MGNLASKVLKISTCDFKKISGRDKTRKKIVQENIEINVFLLGTVTILRMLDDLWLNSN